MSKSIFLSSYWLCYTNQHNILITFSSLEGSPAPSKVKGNWCTRPTFSFMARTMSVNVSSFTEDIFLVTSLKYLTFNSRIWNQQKIIFCCFICRSHVVYFRIDSCNKNWLKKYFLLGQATHQHSLHLERPVLQYLDISP